MAEGELSLLKTLIEKKIRAEKPMEQIAMELEMTIEEISEIYHEIKGRILKM